MAITYRAVKGSNLTPTEVDTNFSDLVAVDALKAPLASPALTGVPTAPTAAADTSTTQVATTAFAKAEADAAQTAAQTYADGKVADNLTASTTVAPSKTAVNTALALKANYNAVATETGTSFTLISATHANRATYCTNGSAVTVTWDTGHGMTIGDQGVIYQNGAGAVSIVAGTGTVEVSPNVGLAAAVGASTTSIRGWLQWELVATNTLRITFRGIHRPFITLAKTGGVVSHAPGDTATNTLTTFVIPAGTFTSVDSWFEIFYGIERISGSGSLTCVIRLNSTTLNAISAPTAGSNFHATGRVVNINSLSVQKSGVVSSYIPDAGSAGGAFTENLAADVTLYVRATLSVGTDTFELKYLRINVFNP